MKLLAQFYACLAIIVFIAVIGGSEARSAGLLAAVGNQRGLSAADPPPPSAPHSSPTRQRRDAPNPPPMPGKPGEMPKMVAEENPEQDSKRQRRHVPQESGKPEEKPNQLQAEDNTDQEPKRSRRQAPPMPKPPQDMIPQSPKDMMSKMPSGGK